MASPWLPRLTRGNYNVWTGSRLSQNHSSLLRRRHLRTTSRMTMRLSTRLRAAQKSPPMWNMARRKHQEMQSSVAVLPHRHFAPCSPLVPHFRREIVAKEAICHLPSLQWRCRLVGQRIPFIPRPRWTAAVRLSDHRSDSRSSHRHPSVQRSRSHCWRKVIKMLEIRSCWSLPVFNPLTVAIRGYGYKFFVN